MKHKLKNKVLILDLRNFWKELFLHLNFYHDHKQLYMPMFENENMLNANWIKTC